MELDMPERVTQDFSGEINPSLKESVYEDMNKVKEFVVQDQSIYKDAKALNLNKKPQVKRPGTAKNKGNVATPEENVNEKVERERKQTNDA